mmetsp:Transcript_22643/g.89580  ORF Transcript_22643/g.89580 Transcript_22643/m.89580 type:complete len:208 (+) Transcript_22643:1646-2269(+)
MGDSSLISVIRPSMAVWRCLPGLGEKFLLKRSVFRSVCLPRPSQRATTPSSPKSLSLRSRSTMFLAVGTTSARARAPATPNLFSAMLRVNSLRYMLPPMALMIDLTPLTSSCVPRSERFVRVAVDWRKVLRDWVDLAPNLFDDTSIERISWQPRTIAGMIVSRLAEVVPMWSTCSLLGLASHEARALLPSASRVLPRMVSVWRVACM